MEEITVENIVHTQNSINMVPNTVPNMIPNSVPKEDKKCGKFRIKKTQKLHKSVSKCTSSTPRNERSCLYRASGHVIGWIESLCGFWGYLVASNPKKAVLISVILAAISGCGLYYLKFEFRPYKLWVKQPSEFREVHEWKMAKFPNTIRKHIAIWHTDNILTAKAINQMWELHQEVENSVTPKGNVKYNDVCLKIPSLIRKKSATITEYDYTIRPEWLSRDKRSDEYYDYYKDYNDQIDYKDDNTPAKDKLNNPVDKYEKSDSKKTKLSFDYPDNIPSESIKSEIPSWINNKPNSKAGPSWLSSFIEDTSTQTLVVSINDSLKERQEHCEFVQELELICYEESLLEVWGYNDNIIKNLTNEIVIKDINEFRSSQVTGFPRNITSYLGSIERDIMGKIISAKGALYTWYTKVNMDAIRKCEKTNCKIEIDLGSGEEVDEEGMEWEVHLSRIVDRYKSEGMPINLQASYLFGSVHRSALFQDIIWVCAGWGLLMVYVIATLGKPFSQDRQIIPVIVGILCVGLSVLASYGICTISGIPYGPLNSVLPILLIALGVDDMYVILNAWESCESDVNPNDITLRTRKTLNQAGLAVTVTSLTDVVAFVIGATTEVPALKYFCVYAAVGIAVVYILQTTLFVAAIVLNQKSKKDTQKSCLPCTTQSRPNTKNSLNVFIGKWMGKWVKFLLRPPVTAFVLLSTGFFLGTALSQALQLQQKFESVWLLPKSSDLYKWFNTMDAIFPKDGREGFIFFENVNFPEDIPKLKVITNNLRQNSYISRVDAWFEKLLDFIKREHLFKNKQLTKEVFYDALSYFLFNEDGAKYRNDIVFTNSSELQCTKFSPEFTTFKISFQYVRLNRAIKVEAQDAMNSVRQNVASANLSGYSAPWALSYGQWETENIISSELLRNVMVVLIIVFVMTMVLLASFRAALLVLMCVLSTLVDVAALMHIWGLTINTVSCIALILAIGICVDYSAHITHGFLVSQGSRKYRAEAALNHMGPAVLHGGISTLLAFVLLAPSDTFVFLSYFKILTGVAVFGLYHAIVPLPILLALLGPPPYPASPKEPEDSHSTTTESTSFPCTPKSNSPTGTPPNSPKSDNKVEDRQTLKEDKKCVFLETISYDVDSKGLGKQAVKNITLDTPHRVNMIIKNERCKEDLEEIKHFSLIESPAIRKENILKLYITNS